MAKCKLHVRRLTLVPGALRRRNAEDDEGVIDDLAESILAREHLHQAVQISTESSPAKKMGPHIHGIDDRLSGRFWATGNDSESELGSVVEEQYDLSSKVSVVDSNTVVWFCKDQGVV
jgi:hypothetical protein